MVSDGRPESHRRRRSGRNGRVSLGSALRAGSPAGRRIVALGVVGLIAVSAIGTAIVLSGGFGGVSAGGSGSGGPSLGLSGGGGASGAPGATDTLPPIATSPPTPLPSPTPAGIVATHILIARLGIDLPIVEGDGLDAPLGKAAHYPGSAWPGGGSNIYIYGHARVGMFLSLWQAQVGDKVVLTLADGTKRTYVVRKVLPDVPWDDVSYLNPTPTEQLTLQTSTSYYATAPRFVVIAVPQS
ncbi:MAG: sortase [Chloroflexi bacterium]|nr:sortase [Chloroflexota bacterium]